MNRRQFLLLAQALGLSAWFGGMAFAQADVIRTRKSATSPAASGDIETLRRGVAILVSETAATQYKSWMYWANSHGTPNTIPPSMTNVWAQCHHGTPHFLTWHRAYVLFFESLIREITQQDDFALPYWDWFGSSSMPKEFADKTSSGEENPLFHKSRAFLKRTLVKAALNEPTFVNFQSTLEGNPHGTVHVMVGGEMGYQETSARDPIFWAHHTNIDRMWNVWLTLDGARRNPTDRNWLNQQFVFDVDGKKAITVSDMLNNEALGYRYDNVAVTGPSDVIPPRPNNNLLVKGTANMKSLGLTPQALATKNKVKLTGKSLNVQLLVPSSSSEKMSTMAISPQGEAVHLSLVLEGIKATELGLKRGFEYRIYVNLPKQVSSNNQFQNHYIGVINSFQLGQHAKHGTSITYQISSLAEKQSKTASWSTSDVNLSLVSDDNEEKQPLIEIENIKLIMSTEPLK